MPTTYQKQRDARLASILAALPKDANPMLRQFTRQFYAKTPVTDLERFDLKYAVALAVSAFAFASKRTGHAPAIRIFTPNKEGHGYEGKYPVVELLNDDMPFLV